MKKKIKLFLKKISLKRKIRECEDIEYEFLLRRTNLRGRIVVLLHEKDMPTNKNRTDYFDKEIENLEDLVKCYDDACENVRKNLIDYKRQLNELGGQ